MESQKETIKKRLNHLKLKFAKRNVCKPLEKVPETFNKVKIRYKLMGEVKISTTKRAWVHEDVIRYEVRNNEEIDVIETLQKDTLFSNITKKDEKSRPTHVS